MRMSRVALCALVLILLVLPIYAIEISISQNDIDSIGGTGGVSVSSPGNISKVKWVMKGSAPYEIDVVKVIWTPVETSVSYTVYVTLYDNNNDIIASGSASQSGSNQQVTTEVNIDDVNPRNVHKVEIVIVEE